MKVTLSHQLLQEATIQIPPSKSLSHRALLCASLAKGESKIKNLANNKDIRATLNCLKEIGIPFQFEEDCCLMQGNQFQVKTVELDCKESASTLRFLIPLLSVLGFEVTYHGQGRVMQRPLQVYEEIFNIQNIKFEIGQDTLVVGAGLHADDFTIVGNISSQFITGLLYACPLMEKPSTITIVPPYESKPYVVLTEACLKHSGIQIEDEGYIIRIPGKQEFHPIQVTIEGDDSQGAFFGCCSYLGNIPITVSGLNTQSLQGDHAIIDILSQFGGSYELVKEGYRYLPKPLTPTTIDLRDCPDLGTCLFVLASTLEGTTTFQHIHRLRYKESNRLACMKQELEKLGVIWQEEEDQLKITGNPKMHGPIIFDGHQDHRVVMALSILAAYLKEPVTIFGVEAITKSYPSFFQDLEKIGINVQLEDE